MNNRKLKKNAKDIVVNMLNGRCIPEDSDVSQYADNPQDIEALKRAVQEVLDGLCRKLTA